MDKYSRKGHIVCKYTVLEQVLIALTVKSTSTEAGVIEVTAK